MCLPIPNFRSPAVLDMGLPAVVPRLLYGSKRTGHPLFFKPQYLSFISPTLQILIIPIIGYMIYKALKKSKAAGLVLLWFLATYVIWIPLDIISNRTTFVVLFSIHDARNLHRYRDCNIRLAKLFKETAGRTEPVKRPVSYWSYQRNRLLPMPAPGVFYSL